MALGADMDIKQSLEPGATRHWVAVATDGVYGKPVQAFKLAFLVALGLEPRQLRHVARDSAYPE